MSSQLMRPKAFEDWKRWGMLVKSWAMGVNLFDQSQPAPRIPTDLEDFKKVLSEHMIEMQFSPQLKGFAVMQSSDNTFVLKLPPRKLLTDSHAALSDDPGGYDLPMFYPIAFGVSSFDINGMDPKDFHACRIGDYTLSTCA